MRISALAALILMSSASAALPAHAQASLSDMNIDALESPVRDHLDVHDEATYDEPDGREL